MLLIQLKSRKSGRPDADTWADTQEKAGLSGKKVLSDYRSLAAKYEQSSPYKK